MVISFLTIQTALSPVTSVNYPHLSSMSNLLGYFIIFMPVSLEYCHSFLIYKEMIKIVLASFSYNDLNMIIYKYL